MHARPRTRLLFIRRPDRRGREDFRAYAATSREGEESLRCASFSSYEELRTLDLARAGEPLDRPLFLVCTHGKHDPCCARYGRPLFEALPSRSRRRPSGRRPTSAATASPATSSVSRAACTTGASSGRTRGRVLDAHLEDTIELAHYRGRSCYSFAAQAVERDIRERTGLLRLDDLRLVSEQGSQIAFADREGNVHEREVTLELGPSDFLTCTADEMHRPRRYLVVSG